VRDSGSGGRDASRGQSEVIGYVLVFSVVLISLGVVSTFGVTALQEVRDATVVDNGEVAMEVLSTNTEAVYYGETTGRTTAFSLDSASLETGQQVTIDVRAGGSSVGSAPWIFRPIVYRGADAALVYENSAVVREQPDGAVAVTDHLFRYSPGSTDRAVVPVVLTKAATVQSVSGGTKRVVTERAGDASVVRSGSPVTVEFEMTWSGSSLPNRADVWQRSLNEEIPASAVPTGSTACESDTSTTDPDIVCEFETDTLVVSVVEIDYEFE